MSIPRRAIERLLEGGAVLALVLTVAAGTPLAAQSRGHSSGSGGGRTAAPSGGGSSHSSPSSSGSSTHSSGGRTAHPTGSGGLPATRQPSHHHFGGGHFRGGVFYPYYSPFYGPYWYDSFFGWGYPYPYDDPYYGGYGGGYRRGYRNGDMGALDLDVSPGNAEVYVDGERIGRATDFDGWPQYLWLEKGTYDVVFYKDGYKTIARQITIYPGLVIDVDDQMEPGQSVRPEDLATKTHERRDERLRYESERRERIERGDHDRGDYDRGEDGDWHDRARDERRHRRDEGDMDAHAVRVRIDVEPADASVYVDGHFMGSGAQLSRSGLRLEPGQHHIAVVRPGHKSEEKDFEVEAGKSVELEIHLDRS
jgi:PEGA domain-containing protein